MQVEEDPSSQFVDFTNATASEQFVSDVEQALIGWQLANKGHASLEALAAAASPAPGKKKTLSTSPKRPSELDAAVWTKELQFLAPGQNVPKTYALSLFVAKHQAPVKPSEEPSRTNRKLKKWQEGLEHFTPTMLSVADGSKDFQWGVIREEDVGEEEEEELAASYYTSAIQDDGEPVFSRKTAFTNVQKWFGVDEFLLLSRSSPHEKTVEKDGPKMVVKSETETDTVQEVEAESKEDGDIENVETNVVDDGENDESDEDDDEDAMANIQVDQNEAGMLVSALTMALNNCNCTIPGFVPVFEPSRGTWIGSAVPGATGNVSMSFDTDSVPELNPNQSCISGLLDFFKAKLQLSPRVEEKCRVEADESGDLAIGMMVSASFGYSWNRAEDPREVMTPETRLKWRTLDYHLPAQERDHIEQITRTLFGNAHATTPLVGTSTSPLDGMDLTISWPKLREGTYVDNVVHSTLDPSLAPQWMLSVHFKDLVSENPRKPQLPLSKQMANLVQVYSNSKELNKDILVSELAPPMPMAPSPVAASVGNSCTSAGSTENSASQSSSSIAESIPAARGAAVVLGNAISSLVSVATWKGSDLEEIRRIVSELFDEGDSGDKNEDRDIQATSRVHTATVPSSVQHGAPLGELVSILATRMAQLHSINTMSLLWVEFVKALRERWFQQQLLPFMSTSSKEGFPDHNTSSHSLGALFLLDSDTLQLPPPDFRHCLLHQKLQLLNCCILRNAQEFEPKSSTEDKIKTSHTRHKSSNMPGKVIHTALSSNGEEGEGDLDGGPSDDEFFDSIEQQDSAPSSASPRPGMSPEGVIREVTGVVCLQTNEPLLEPVTQTGVPMTEDVAKEQQDLLTRLGVSVESDKLRQQIQSTVLISDMQAFKAANPRSCLADFIRWYSPKDWVPFDTPIDANNTDLPQEGRGIWWFEQHGMLSERMRFGSGHEHLWQQMWETSAPVPASRQKRLFDPLQESEKVYHYMETLSPHELFHQMLAGAISSSVFALETALPVHVSAKTLPVVHRALKMLRSRGNRAIALLDDALMESQVAFPTAGRSKELQSDRQDQSVAAAHQGQQLQVAFEMALDSCWKLVRSLEAVEALITKAMTLLYYFPTSEAETSSLELVNLLLLPSLSHRQQMEISNLLKQEQLRQQISALVLTNPTLAEAGPMTAPVQRENVLRCICPRPFLREYYGDLTLIEDDANGGIEQPEQELEESPLVVCRMYAAFKKSTVRFALVLAESEF